jgi:predicted TIM-barrel fold metal-dependent hydrolase
MLITDAQIHTFTGPPDVRDRSTLPRGTHRTSFPIEQVIAEMDSIGVQRAVLVPPNSMMRDAVAYSEAAARNHPGRFGLMPMLNPTDPTAPETLRNLPRQTDWLGIRLALGAHLDLLDGDSLEWLWATCEQQNTPVTCLISGHAGRLQPVAARHPNLTLIVDHMGRVPDVQGSAAFGAIDGLLALAQWERVAVKMTSVPDSSAETYPFGDLAEGIRRIYDAFGPQRLLWGSDLSGLSCTYAECLGHFRQGLPFLSETDKEWILGKAAASVLNWPEP